MSSDLLSYYNEKIKSNPLLTKDQEIELGRRIKNGDQDARIKMIERKSINEETKTKVAINTSKKSNIIKKKNNSGIEIIVKVINQWR